VIEVKRPEREMLFKEPAILTPPSRPATNLFSPTLRRYLRVFSKEAACLCLQKSNNVTNVDEELILGSPIAGQQSLLAAPGKFLDAEPCPLGCLSCDESLARWKCERPPERLTQIRRSASRRPGISVASMRTHWLPWSIPAI
jgi:hypothetical protein